MATYESRKMLSFSRHLHSSNWSRPQPDQRTIHPVGVVSEQITNVEWCGLIRIRIFVQLEETVRTATADQAVRP